MRLFVIRHGKAERQSASGRDRDRVLMPRGVRQAEHLGTALHDRAPALILSSPYARAWATAEIVQRTLGVPLRAEARLECDRPLSEAIEAIREHAPAGSLAVVGHNPTLSVLVGNLIGKRGVELRTGEAAEIDLDPDTLRGTLLVTLRLHEDE